MRTQRQGRKSKSKRLRPGDKAQDKDRSQRPKDKGKVQDKKRRADGR
jgi:hypothetical protein